MRRTNAVVGLFVVMAGRLLAADVPMTIRADPEAIFLVGPEATQSILVNGQTPEGKISDLTHAARYQSTNTAVCMVDERGRVRSVANGEAAIAIDYRGQRSHVKVTVRESDKLKAWHFEDDIEPIFSRFGCNNSGCHGKAEGQNGFKLSVFGFDAAADYAAILKEARGRRVFTSAPEQSLLLRKASGRVAHGGGTRFAVGSEPYETLRRWIAAGSPFGRDDAPKLTGIRIEPGQRVLGMRKTQQLRVVARYSDQREADVTSRAKFQSNNDGLALANVDGLVTTLDIPGEAAIMATFLNEVAVFRAFVPRQEILPAGPLLPQFNFIDQHVDRKLASLNVRPSAVCDDATYLRRITLDLIGALPTAIEARRFLADTRSDKRARLVDGLMLRPEFADYWALKWSDVLRVDRSLLGHEHAYAYYRWIRESMKSNKPLDRFARELITAEGPLRENGPAGFYKVARKPGEAASSLSQTLLGVRIACAECHHHPYDRWSQNDYYGMVAFFAPVSVKSQGQSDWLIVNGNPQTLHPRTGKPVVAHALGQAMPADNPIGDRRHALADWMTAADNQYFARNMANRLWAHLFGRGIVEPVDDVRATNPPSNPELLNALARSLVEAKFDMRHLLRLIALSRTYQTTAEPNESNARDEQYFSRTLLRRVEAEVLLDMVCQVTGVPEKFRGVTTGARAVQLWDSKVNHYFLKQFGRPERTSACECERNHEPNVAQVLHLLNSPEIHAKLAHDDGLAARVHREIDDDAKLIEELYLTYLSRMPSENERRLTLEYLRGRKDRRRRAVEDVAWALLNSVEFRFNH